MPPKDEPSPLVSRLIITILRNLFNNARNSSDNRGMKIAAMLPVILGVLKNPITIISAAVIILYLNFVFFVARYVKKPPKPKKRKEPKPAPAKKEAEKKEGEDEDTEDAGAED